MTKYRKQAEATTPDETRTVTLDEVRAFRNPFLRNIAAAMLQRHGVYGYTDDATGRKILLRLA